MDRHHKTILLCILFTAFAARIAFAVWWQSKQPVENPFFFGDSASYWELAEKMGRGEPFEFQTAERKIFRTPGYPALLSPLFLSSTWKPNPLWGRLLSICFGTASVWLVFKLGSLLFNPITGLVASGMVSIYPEAIASSGFLLTEAPFTVPMLLQLGFWLRTTNPDSAETKRPYVWSALSGIAAGVATLIRPSWLLFTPFALYFQWIFASHRFATAKYGVISIVGLACVMLPWWIRNYQITRKFVPTTLQVGASLYDGLSPMADGSSNMEPVAEFEKTFSPQEKSNYEYQLDRALAAASMDWAKAHPMRALHLAGVKILRMWNVWPNEASMRSWPIRLGVLLTYLPVMAFALFATVRFRSFGWSVALLWMPAIYLTFLHVVFVSSIRYRLPPMLPLFALAAAGVVLVFCPSTSPLAPNFEGERKK